MEKQLPKLTKDEIIKMIQEKTKILTKEELERVWMLISSLNHVD